MNTSVIEYAKRIEAQKKEKAKADKGVADTVAPVATVTQKKDKGDD